ncbi:unnamed protein product [Calypogeia fissa]
MGDAQNPAWLGSSWSVLDRPQESREMKLHAGIKLPMARQDSKCRRSKKLECDLPVVQGPKTRCTLISALCSSIPRASAKMYLVSFAAGMVLLLGLLPFLRVGSFVTGGIVLPRASILAVKFEFLLGREWRHIRGYHSPNNTYEGYVPPYVADSAECSASISSAAASFVPPMSIKSSPMTKVDYDVCLSVVIGDDGDHPNNEALPYPLVSRLTDALKEEAILSRKYGGKDPSEDVQVLVGVDYGSIVCAIVRDTFAEVPGVKAQCRAFSEIEGAKCVKFVVGSSKRFWPQVPEEWSDIVEWRSRRLVDLDCADPDHQPPALPEEDWQPTIVTGFSSNHMTVGLLLLRSIGKAVRDSDGSFNVSVVVWAMEVFDDEHQGLLDCVMDELIHEYGVRAEVRLFDWSAYPSWMRINQNLGYFGGTGEYAWKAVMVHTVLRERGIVIWGDAGDRFHDSESLIDTLRVLNSTGFVSRTSHGFVYTRTHPLVLKYFRANIPSIWDMENCEAALVGFTLKKYTELARPWYDCSITRQCIAPDGSDRSNHRQDQAALTMLSILSQSPCTGAHPHFSHHADDDPTLKDISGTYLTKCYVDPLILRNQGTVKPPAGNRPHGIIN